MTAQYSLSSPMLAVIVSRETKKVIQVPSGSVVKVAQALRDGASGLIEVMVNGQAALMFAEDIRERGDRLAEASGAGGMKLRAKRLAEKHRWGVILAGGEGARLRSLTRLVAGDDRPKQFCPFLRGQTFLTHTRQRAARSVSPDRTLFVLLKSHEKFYTRELQNVPGSQLIVQPRNRGTLPAVLCSLLQIAQLDPRAVVAFFPSDHYFSDEEGFSATMELAFGAAEAGSHFIVLIGAPATRPETEYGWIEADEAASPVRRHGLLRVKRFWEKPSLQEANDLLDRGSVWNTFVMIGRAATFLNVIRSGAPEFCQSIEPLYLQSEQQMNTLLMSAAYEALPEADLSRQVLSAVPERLRVLSLSDTEWIDAGHPDRLIDVLIRSGELTESLAFQYLTDSIALQDQDRPQVPPSRETGSPNMPLKAARAAS